MSEFLVTLKIKGDGTNAVAEVQKVVKATDKAGDASEKAAEKSRKAWENTGKVIGAAAVTAGAAIAALVGRSLTAADEISKLSQKVGFTVEALSALKYQAGLAGANFGEMEVGLAKFSRTVSEANSGVDAQAAIFKDMGINIRDATGVLRPTSDLLADVADKFEMYADGAAKVDIAMSLFGKSGANMIPLLNGGSKAMRENAEEAAALGVVYATNTAQAAELFNDNLSRLNSATEGFGNLVIQNLLPSMNALTNMFVEEAKGTDAMRQSADLLADSIRWVVKTFYQAKGVIEQLVNIIAAGVDTIVESIKIIGGTIKGLVNIGEAVLLAQQGRYSEAAAVANAAKDDIANTWAKGAQNIQNSWSAAGDGIQYAAENTQALIAALYTPAEEVAKRGKDFKDVVGGIGEFVAKVLPPTLSLGTAATTVADASEKIFDNVIKMSEGYASTILDMQEELDGVSEAQREYNRAMAEVSAIEEALLQTKPALTAEEQARLEILRGQIDLIRELTEASREDPLKEMNKGFEEQRKKLGLNRRELAGYNAVLDITEKVQAEFGNELKKMPGYLDMMQRKARENALALFDMEEAATNFQDVMSRYTEEKSPFFQMSEDLDVLNAKLKEVLGDPDKAKPIEEAIARLNDQIRDESLNSMKALLGAVQTFTKDGSKGFDLMQKGMAAIQIVQDLIAIKAAVIDILTQGQGDPYSAWARMAAMAAAVAPLLASIGASIGAFSGGGGGHDPTEARQASQGTGTILGDATAKSESILNAVEITADATEKLVGLNRGMLSALQSLQEALGAAGGQLARGAADVDFQTQGGGSLFLGLWGNSTRIVDQGITIAGGVLQDMIDNIAVGAYQTVHRNGGLFGGSSTFDETTDISDEVGAQFQLVIGSIIDSVREGALALGLVPAEIDAAIAAYRIAAVRISLEDLSAEEQQAELEAVFSSIFDGLAGSVVPFIEQFQQVGEGLGETLIRVATGVQVTQEAVRQLGFSLDETDPEKFAQISEGLIGMVGGIDEFISSMQNFVSNFAPEAYQFQVASDALVSAFAQAGLTIPATADDMWELMRSLDATTEQGRDQIATLLRLSEVAGTYYDLLDKQTGILQDLGIIGGGLSEFGRGIREIRSSSSQAIQTLDALARAQGREGASAVDLAKVHNWTAREIAKAIKVLQQQTQDLISQLYGGIPGTLDEINSQISDLESSIGGGFNSAAQSADNFFEAWNSGMQSLDEYLNQMLFGDLSALSPEEQLAEMWRQFNDAQQAALNGDTEALASLPQMANALLEMIRNTDASGSDYNAQFNLVRDLLQEVQGTANPYNAPSNNSVTLIPSAELEALYAARDALLAEQESLYRQDLARQLAQNLSDLATMLQTPILELIQLQGVSLENLATDLGINLQELTSESVIALGDLALTLGLSLTDLTNELGISLTDLAGGLTELTSSIGIDLANLTVANVQSLAAIGASLGANLSELSTALSIDLGSLADSQSLLNEALREQIVGLPEDQAAALAPLLDAVANATTEADANTAIAALEDAINLLGPDIRNQLAPYFENVFPSQALSELENLSSIREINADQLDMMTNINRNLKAANEAAGLPSYDVGTGFVPVTGPAMIHRGEAIIPSDVSSWLRKNGFPANNTASLNMGPEIAAMRRELSELKVAVAQGSRLVADTVSSSSEKNSRENVQAIIAQTNRIEPTSKSSRF